MSKSLYGVLMVCALFVAAAQLPAVAEEAACGAVPERSEEAAVRQAFVYSITVGMVKGLQLTGREVSTEQQARLRGVAEESFTKIYARIKAAGLAEDYKKQMFDPDIRKFDKQVLEAKTMSEIAPIAQAQMKALNEKYPKLVEFMNTDREFQAITMEMMQKIAKALK